MPALGEGRGTRDLGVSDGLKVGGAWALGLDQGCRSGPDTSNRADRLPLHLLFLFCSIEIVMVPVGVVGKLNGITFVKSLMECLICNSRYLIACTSHNQ